MRLWSISFEYLDAKGLVALWREALLAKAVLKDETKGYKMHPQLKRFKDTSDPVAYINEYLYYIAEEADKRNYKFDHTKYSRFQIDSRIKITRGQIQYEFSHLKKKLKKRDPELFNLIARLKSPKTMALMEIIDGNIESWEIINR